MSRCLFCGWELIGRGDMTGTWRDEEPGKGSTVTGSGSSMSVVESVVSSNMSSLMTVVYMASELVTSVISGDSVVVSSPSRMDCVVSSSPVSDLLRPPPRPGKPMARFRLFPLLSP